MSSIPRTILLGLCAALTTIPGVAEGDPGDQIIKITVSGANNNDYLGSAVAICPSAAIIGARGEDDGATDAGAAYLFRMADPGGVMIKLLADRPDSFSGFGQKVAITDRIAAVGAPFQASHGVVFVYDTVTGTPIRTFEAVMPQTGARFGSAVAFTGKPGDERCVIGASRTSNTNGHMAGSAFVFDVVTGEHIRTLIATDGSAGENLGDAVDIAGPPGAEVALVGAPGGTGKAYLFDLQTGAQSTFMAPGIGPKLLFGATVALAGPTGVEFALIGAPGYDESPAKGKVYVFDTATQELLHILEASDAQVGDGFGSGLDAIGDLAVIGAWREDEDGIDAGSAYRFDIPSGRELQKITPATGLPDARFGNAISLTRSGDAIVAAVGATRDDERHNQAGATYLMAASDFACAADLTGDAVVDAADLYVLLTSWGACTPCIADLRPDNTVDRFDLARLLAAWGACE